MPNKRRIIAVIPARLSSTRFPRKLIEPLHGLPIIEHVRRRALISQSFTDVYVATCDGEIEDLIKKNHGQVILTSNEHDNGTSRVLEAVRNLDFGHVVLLQGDEPLVLPRHLSMLVDSIKNRPEVMAWNLVSKFHSSDDYQARSSVKCAITKSSEIIYCSRQALGVSRNIMQYTRKMLGIMAFSSGFIDKFKDAEDTIIQQSESIEQMKILENRLSLTSLEIHESLPSVNYKEDLDLVKQILSNNKEQRQILDSILTM